MEWIDSELTPKVMAFSEVLAQHIRNTCACEFPTSHIYQASFRCSNSSPDHVTFRAKIVAFSNTWTADLLADVVESWVMSKEVVSVFGEVLRIDTQCPVVIMSLHDTECTHTESKVSLPVLIAGSVSSCAFIFLLVMIVCSILCKRYVCIIKSRSQVDICSF